MKIFTFLQAIAVKACMTLLLLAALNRTNANPPNCSNFKVSLESHSCILGKTVFIWSIKNLQPATSPNLNYWGLTLPACVKPKDILFGGCSYKKSSWKNLKVIYKTDSSVSCITVPVVRYNYGTLGKATSYYILILKGNYQTAPASAYLKYGTGCCVKTIQGVGCDCSSLGVPTVLGTSRCGPGTVTLIANSFSGATLKWYTTSSGGSPVGSGSSYSPNINATTTYYVSATLGSCEGLRAAVTGTVNPAPGLPLVQGGQRCGSGNAILSASGCSDGTLNWYSSATGGDPIDSGSSYKPYLFYDPYPLYNTNHKSYFVACKANGCESERAEVVADVLFTGMVPATVTGAAICSPGNVVLKAVCPNGVTPAWHLQMGSPPFASGLTYTAYVQYTTTFYVSCPACANPAGRVPVTAEVNNCNPVSAKAGTENNLGGKMKEMLTVSPSPNPFADKVKFVIQLPVAADASLDIYSLTGQKIKNLYNGYIEAGLGKTVDFSVPETLRSNLVYRLTAGKEVRTGILIHGR